jgi:hypothetical protein
MLMIKKNKKKIYWLLKILYLGKKENELTGIPIDVTIRWIPRCRTNLKNDKEKIDYQLKFFILLEAYRSHDFEKKSLGAVPREV